MNKSQSGSTGRQSGAADKAARDNRARQLNPEHDAYWKSRGLDGRPDSSSGGAVKKSR